MALLTTLQPRYAHFVSGGVMSEVGGEILACLRLLYSLSSNFFLLTSHFRAHQVSVPVWALSLSLAATQEIDRTEVRFISFSSYGYLDVSVPRVPSILPMCSEGSTGPLRPDRKSTRLNSSHVRISYAVF